MHTTYIEHIGHIKYIDYIISKHTIDVILYS